MTEDEELELLELEEAEHQYQKSKSPAAPKASQTESALRGAAQGGSFGFADEIAGAFGGIGDDLKGFITGEGSTEPTYEKHRNEYRANDLAAQTANPKTFGAGEFGGTMASSFVPGLNIAKAGGALGRMGMAGAQGAIQGAGNAAEIADVPLEALKGGGIGLASGAGGEAVGIGINKATSAMDNGINSIHKQLTGTGSLLDDMPKSNNWFLDDIKKVQNQENSPGLIQKAKGLMESPVGKKVTDMALDKIPYGRQMVKFSANKLEDYVKSNPQMFGKYAGTLSAAAQRGGNSLASTSFILQQQDPEFRQMIQEMGGNEPGK